MCRCISPIPRTIPVSPNLDLRHSFLHAKHEHIELEKPTCPLQSAGCRVLRCYHGLVGASDGVGGQVPVGGGDEGRDPFVGGLGLVLEQLLDGSLWEALEKRKKG